MTIQEARVKGKKLRLAPHRAKVIFAKRKAGFEQAIRDLQRTCPHDLNEEHCAACGKEFDNGN